jgi:hypothetical protein
MSYCPADKGLASLPAGVRQAGAQPSPVHAGRRASAYAGLCPDGPGLAGHFAPRPPSPARWPQLAERACARYADRVKFPPTRGSPLALPLCRRARG